MVINGNGHTIDAGGTTRILIVGVELDSSAGFDTTEYLAAYPDFAAANVNPLLHYLQFGVHEFGVQ